MKFSLLPRFSLRDVLWVTVIVGLVVAWTKDRRDLDQRLKRIEASAFPINASYGANQLLGKPDATSGGDNYSAWCPATADGQAEWLDLSYPRRTLVTGVSVYENMELGAVVRITGFDWWGNEVTLWTGTDPLKGQTSVGVAKIQLSQTIRTKRLKIYLDSPAVKGWNEIDTVGMVDERGAVQWPVEAKVSSTYGSSSSYGRSRLVGAR